MDDWWLLAGDFCGAISGSEKVGAGGRLHPVLLQFSGLFSRFFVSGFQQEFGG
jgi:hypothetical protein